MFRSKPWTEIAKRARRVGALAVMALAVFLIGAGITGLTRPRIAEAEGPTIIPGGTITGSVTWTAAGSPYIVQGSVTVADTGQLTIEPGVEVRFGDNVYLWVSGRLVAEGGATAPITFTTASTTTVVPGRWYFIRFASGSSGVMRRCVVNSAGAANYAALWIESSNVVVEDCRIHHNAGAGAYVVGSAPTLAGNAIYLNGGPGLVTSNSQPILRGNLFYRNAGFGIRNDTPARTVNARQQAWGHPTGPYHPSRNPMGLGDRVSDGVDFEPWLRGAGVFIPENQPPQAFVVNPAADGFTFNALPLQFRIWVTDTDALTGTTFIPMIYLRAEIRQGGTVVAVYDQVESPAGWDRGFYRIESSEGVTATLTLTRALPPGDYTIRVTAFDGIGMGTGPERAFSVNLTAWGIASVQPEEILATPHVTPTLTLYGSGFRSDAEVWLETRFISGTVTQTVRDAPAAVRVLSSESIELDVNMTYPGPWDVVVRQGSEERRTRLWVLPYFPLMRIAYEKSPVFSPGRNWMHYMTLSNEGTAPGVAVVALRPPTGTLLIATTPNAELLGSLDSPLGNVYFVAVRVDPGQRQRVGLTYNLPWSAVNITGGLRLGDPTDFAYYLVGQPLAELWEDIQGVARQGNENNPIGYLDDLVTLSLWATGELEGWALQAFRELPDEEMAYGYIDQVSKRYPWVADALMAEYLLELRTTMEDLLRQRVQSAGNLSGAGALRPAGEGGGFSFRQWLYDWVGPDPWAVVKGTFSWKETVQSLTSGESAVFLLAEVEGAIGNLTFGLWRPKLGSEWLAKSLCLNPDLVRVGRGWGEGLAFAATLPAIPTRAGGLTSAFAFSARNTFQKLAKTPKPPDIKLATIRHNLSKITAKLVPTRGNKLEPERWGVDVVVETENVFQPGPSGFVMLGTKRIDSFNFYHWGKTAKGEDHHGLLWQFNGSMNVWTNETTWYAGPHIYENRLYIPWKNIGEIPIEEVREIYAISSTALRSGSFQQTMVTPVELEEAGQKPGTSCQPLRGAYDPNEIVGVPDYPFIRPEHTLNLIIHFENIGTDPAETVEITMTIPSELDLESISVLGSTHPMKPTLDPEQRILRLIFENINLPPNRPPNQGEGEGWVRLQARPQADLPSGTQIRLLAEIVFWSFGAPNPPIRTNELVYTIDVTPPAIHLQEARVEGSEVILRLQGEDSHSGVQAVQALYTQDGKNWFYGSGVRFEPVRNNIDETIRFLPRFGGPITVQVLGFDVMNHVTATESIAIQVPYRLFLPLVLRQAGGARSSGQAVEEGAPAAPSIPTPEPREMAPPPGSALPAFRKVPRRRRAHP